MRVLRYVILLLLVSGAAQADIDWNKPGAMPYTGTPSLAIQKMAYLIKNPVVEKQFLEWATALRAGEMPHGCRSTQFVGNDGHPLQLTAMMSGAERLIPNVVVTWPSTAPPSVTRNAIMCTATVGEWEYVLVDPGACGNFSLIVLFEGRCVPNPATCDRECKDYVRKNVT